jgi:glycosyltransferase involved in cell wall biosynthesis
VVFLAINKTPKIGLVGPTRGYGLAYQNRDIAAKLPVASWLTADQFPMTAGCACRVDRASPTVGPGELRDWLASLDAIVFVERPSFDSLPAIAQAAGVAVICVPNWEWLHPELPWLAHVDAMVCPTQHTLGFLNDWKARYGFRWSLAHVPWPVDTERFHYQPRRVCRRFVFVLGSGGTLAVGRQSGIAFRRKGLDVVLAAAERAPEVSVIVYAYRQQVPPLLPANVEVRQPPLDNRLLYRDGDVCVQPSHWEGLGLPLLECQAAGMPLVTTDAAPMNEHRPIATIPADCEIASLTGQIEIPAARILPADLAAVLRGLRGQSIGGASRRARRFIEREHSWPAAAPKLRKLIRQAIDVRRGADRDASVHMRRIGHAT